jgi:hypothetical protein
MKRIKEKLQSLSRRSSFRSLLQTILYSNKRNINRSSKLFDLLPKLNQRSSQPHHSGININKLSAKINEISIIAID